MKIRPLQDRVVVKVIEEESKSAGGIVLMESSKEKPSRGEVIAVGAGKKIDGQLVPMDIKVGDKVLFGKYSGSPVKLGEDEVLVMKEDEIFGIIE